MRAVEVLILLVLLLSMAVGITIRASHQVCKDRRWFRALCKWVKDIFDLLFTIG